MYLCMHMYTPIHACKLQMQKSLIFDIYKLWRDYLQICCTFKQNTRTVEEEESPQLPDTYVQALS